MNKIQFKFFMKKHKLEIICILLILALIGICIFYTPFKQKIYPNSTSASSTTNIKNASNNNSSISKNNSSSNSSIDNKKTDIPSDIVIQSKSSKVVPFNNSQEVKNYLETSNVITKNDTSAVHKFITDYINTLKENNKLSNLNYYYPAERAEFYKENKYDFYSDNGYIFNVSNIKITDKGAYSKAISCAYCNVYDVTYDLTATLNKTKLNYQIHSIYYITKFQNQFYIVDFSKTCAKK